MALIRFPVNITTINGKTKKLPPAKHCWKTKIWPEEVIDAAKNIGVVIPANVFVIDLDIYKGVKKTDVEKALGAAIDWDAAFLQSTVRGGQHFAFYCEQVNQMRQGDELFKIPGFDSRCAGRGWVCTGEGYQGDILAKLGDVSKLPTLPHSAIKKLMSGKVDTKSDFDLLSFDDMIDAQIIDWSKEQVVSAVMEQLEPIDSPYNEWLNVGMAIHHQSEGKKWGFKLFCDWSKQCENYDFEEIRNKWRSFEKSGADKKITFRTVIKEWGLTRPDIGQELETDEKSTSRLTTLDLNFLNRKPEKRKMIGDRFPVGCTSAVVAMGGAGKTQWLTREALILAASDVKTLFVSSEDGTEDYQAKIYNAVRAPDVNFNLDSLVGNISFLDLRGVGSKLVTSKEGNFVPADAVKKVREIVQKLGADLVIFETLSRFAGGEENERFEACITACDAVAKACECAVVLVHHTGKSQARDKVIDLYSGRGGSVLGDNTRSMTVLTTLDDDYTGDENVICDAEDLANGSVFEVKHVRSSYTATKSAQYFVKRAGECNGPMLVELSIGTDEDMQRLAIERLEKRDRKTVEKIIEVIKGQGGTVIRSFFDRETRAKIGVSQKDSRAIIEQMILDGVLMDEQIPTRSGQKKRMLKVCDEPLTKLDGACDF
jgi:KaiC/GvpD/RAD55 family RecA-like ATPase